MEFFACILSFYGIYYSYKGNTFFYYYCYDILPTCQELFSFQNKNGIQHLDLYYNGMKNELKSQYFYFKIYLNNGHKGFFYIGMIVRAIVLIWNITTIANYLIYINICGGFNELKRVVYFIRNLDGTITDLNDISIKEVQEGYKANEGGSAYKEEEKENKKYNKLERVCLKKNSYKYDIF